MSGASRVSRSIRLIDAGLQQLAPTKGTRECLDHGVIHSRPIWNSCGSSWRRPVHGTPALLTRYDVKFTTLERVKAHPPLKVKPRYKDYDWLQTVGQKTINAIPIPAGKDLVFGGFWYFDFQRQEQCFRFILTIDQHTTYPNIADEVDASYTFWD